MAQTINFDDLDNQPQQQGQQQQQAGGQNQSVQAGPQDTNQYKPDAYNAQKRGSGYTNIQRVVQANQPQQLAQAVAGNVQRGTQQAQQQVQQAGQQFQQQAAANQFDTANNQQLVQNVLADPTQFIAQDNNNPNSAQGSLFSRLMSGQYAGPQGLQNQADLDAQVGGVQQLGRALGSAGGQMGLLQRTVGGPQYQQGQQRLDQLILSQAQSPELREARQKAMALGNILGRQEAGAQEFGQELANRAQGFGKDVQQQFGQAVTTQDAALQEQAKQAQESRDALYKKTLEDLQSGKITQEQADLLGLGAGTQVTGNLLQNIGQYLSKNPEQATAQNVASNQDYARLDALRKLAGSYSPEEAQKVLGQYSGQNEQAGRFQAGGDFKADKEGFQNILGSQMQEYQAKLAPVQGSLDAAKEIYSLTQKRDQYQTMDPRWHQAQQEIAKKYPGAVTNGYTRPDWAAGLLQSAQKKYNDTQASLTSAYGGLKGIEITPNQQPQPELAGNPINLENANIFRVT